MSCLNNFQVADLSTHQNNHSKDCLQKTSSLTTSYDAPNLTEEGRQSLSPSWDDSANKKGHQMTALHPPLEEITKFKPAPSLGVEVPSKLELKEPSSVTTQLSPQPQGGRSTPPHLRRLIPKPQDSSKKAEASHLNDGSSKKPKENIQVEHPSINNGDQISKDQPQNYLPPHLRPSIPKATSDKKGEGEKWIPPHLRQPITAKACEPRPKTSNSESPEVNGGRGLDITNSEASIALEPVDKAPTENQSRLIDLGVPTKQTDDARIEESPRILEKMADHTTRAAGPEPRKSLFIVAQTDVKLFQKPGVKSGCSVSLTSPPKSCALDTPSPKSLPPRSSPAPVASHGCDEGIQSISQQGDRASCNLPWTPPYSRRGGFISLAHSGKSPNHKQPGRSPDPTQLALSHEEFRKRRSYTRYMVKPADAPIQPRIQFRSIQWGFSNDVGGFEESPESSTESDGGHYNPAAIVARGTREIRRVEYGLPTSEEIGRFVEMAALESQNCLNGYALNGEDDKRPYGGERGCHEENQSQWNCSQSEIMSLHSVAEPLVTPIEPKKDFRSIFLIGLPQNMTLKQVSRICSGSGLIESIQISRDKGIALVSFVVAAAAKQFYETTKDNGVTLIFLDEDKSTAKKQIVVKMDIQETFVDHDVLHTIHKRNGSRVLNILGWDRKSLENLVGPVGEQEADLTDLLSRLALQYVLRYLDTNNGQPKIQEVSWEVNRYGYLQATLVFSAIRDAMIIRQYMEEDIGLEGCFISFGKDPCIS